MSQPTHEEQVQMARELMEKVAQKLGADEAFQQQMENDPDSALVQMGFTPEAVEAMKDQAPEVEGHGAHDSCWTWTSIKCGGSSSGGTRPAPSVSPRFNPGSFRPSGAGYFISTNGGN